VHLQGGERSLRILLEGTLTDDVQAGEIAGAIHNFGVQAHVGEDGAFLSDGSAWYPQWIDEATAIPELLPVSVPIVPIEGWSFVASGDPAEVSHDFTAPLGEWRTPRALEGVAIAGNRHRMQGTV